MNWLHNNGNSALSGTNKIATKTRNPNPSTPNWYARKPAVNMLPHVMSLEYMVATRSSTPQCGHFSDPASLFLHHDSGVEQRGQTSKRIVISEA
jgi:hypothetical protein